MASKDASSPTAASKPRVSWGGPPGKRKLVGRMGPWQLVRLLGEGAMSRVYLARPLATPEAPPTYAVKALRKEWWTDATAVDLMRREASVGAQVSHANVAPILSAQLDRPPYFVAMPRLPGETLAAKLERGEQLPLPQALWTARQTAVALDAILTTTGMTHGDVAPRNVLISPEGHTTLLDLGCCQLPSETRSWAGRPIVGTPYYLAPERATSACSIDARSDLYSLGATLYEMLTGTRPFESENAAELLTMHRQAKPRCVRDARPGTPKPVASLVHRLLAKEPLRRPGSPAEVAAELVRLEIACFGDR